ncbi:hypothetical protein PAPYR_246 [Paratrimastix pyriformis]|uniref:sn-1-specific diacylglycerol lipase n=1 Tax=Paratrimastix pyriformis TaxID=342808 RepID=A0ABQ8V050_9EUKA|nr:hypothetical protein PAPYR_246 [Paratrimastix pyriformis]
MADQKQVEKKDQKKDNKSPMFAAAIKQIATKTGNKTLLEVARLLTLMNDDFRDLLYFRGIVSLLQLKEYLCEPSLPRHPPPFFPSPQSQLISKEQLAIDLRMVTFAAAVYGWAYLYYFSRIPHEALSTTAQVVTQGLVTDRIDRQAFIAHTHIDPADLLVAEFSECSYRCRPYCIVLDRVQNSMILTIRGTQAFSDAITDAIASYVPFEARFPVRTPTGQEAAFVDVSEEDLKPSFLECPPSSASPAATPTSTTTTTAAAAAAAAAATTTPATPTPLVSEQTTSKGPEGGEGLPPPGAADDANWRTVRGLAHMGMLESAQHMYKLCMPKVFELMRKHGVTKLNIVGHSLGAGVAALLTMICIEPAIRLGYTIQGHAVACPSVASLNLAVASMPYLRAFAYHHDIIPRLTIGTVKDLSKIIAHKSQEGGAWRALFGVIRGSMPRKMLESLFASPPHEPPPTPLRPEERFPKLYVPGVCVFLEPIVVRQQPATWEATGDLVPVGRTVPVLPPSAPGTTPSPSASGSPAPGAAPATATPATGGWKFPWIKAPASSHKNGAIAAAAAAAAVPVFPYRVRPLEGQTPPPYAYLYAYTNMDPKYAAAASATSPAATAASTPSGPPTPTTTGAEWAANPEELAAMLRQVHVQVADWELDEASSVSTSTSSEAPSHMLPGGDEPDLVLPPDVAAFLREGQTPPASLAERTPPPSPREQTTLSLVTPPRSPERSMTPPPPTPPKTHDFFYRARVKDRNCRGGNFVCSVVHPDYFTEVVLEMDFFHSHLPFNYENALRHLIGAIDPAAPEEPPRPTSLASVFGGGAAAATATAATTTPAAPAAPGSAGSATPPAAASALASPAAGVPAASSDEPPVLRRR